jgi:oxygen-independent coproporphyrinogen-3 oxidase
VSPAADTLSLYVHVPFCARACPYCDFDFEVGRRPDLVTYRAGLSAELAARLDPHARPAVRTIYLGGGTPSLLPADDLRDLLAELHARFDVRALEEATVELNPEHASPDRFAALVDAGVDRVSIGVQSTSAAGLRQLGRVHTADAGPESVQAAVRLGLRTSADLIVGWPGQSEGDLVTDVARLVDAGAEHVSVYALTIEAGTPWPRLVARGLRLLPDTDRQGELLALADAELGARGLAHYEVSSWARPGAESRHNTAYWTWRDVLGLGPSAASVRHLSDGSLRRRTNVRGLSRWAAAPGEAEEEALDPVRAAAEGLWLGLRRLDGLSLPQYLVRFAAVDLAWIERRVRRSVARGNVERLGDRLRIAPGRWLFHDEVGEDVLEPEPVGDAPSGPRR